MSAKDEAPKMRGYVTLQELAERMGISRQYAHEAAEKGRIASLCWTGVRTKPVWMVAEAEAALLEAAGRFPQLRFVSTTEAPDTTGESHDRSNGQPAEGNEREEASHPG
jgi:hypothetical protein